MIQTIPSTKNKIRTAKASFSFMPAALITISKPTKHSNKIINIMDNRTFPPTICNVRNLIIGIFSANETVTIKVFTEISKFLIFRLKNFLLASRNKFYNLILLLVRTTNLWETKEEM